MAGRRKQPERPQYQRRDDANENLERFFDKIPPHDVEAEKALLGAILLSSREFDDIVGLLRAECFYAAANRELWNIAHDMHEASESIDALTVASEADRRGILEEIGGPAYINSVMEACHFTQHAKAYAERVRELWLRRRAILAAQETLREAYETTSDTMEVIEAMESRVLKVVDRAQKPTELQSINEIITDTFRMLETRLHKQDGDLPGLATGIGGFDDLTGGLMPGQLIIVGARPGMGKTALVGNIVRNCCKRNEGVHFASLEMSKLELAERWLQMEARVSGRHIKRPGEMEGDEQERCYQAAQAMRAWPLFINEEVGQTPAMISSDARRVSRQIPLKLIIVDYLQIMELGHTENKFMPREQQISTMTRRMKWMAKDMGLPVIVLSQLNRAVEGREDKKPRLADLRESGAIEQDADIIVFLHRPDAYDPEDRPGECDLIVAKHRGGPVGTIETVWMKEQCKFADKSNVPTPADF